MRIGAGDPEFGQAPDDVVILESFIAALGVGGGTLLDSVVRRAARETLAAAGQSGESRDLFCLLYRLFFAQTVSQFVTTVIAEKVKLAVPALRLVDPAGVIASWIADRVFSLLPNPCDVAVNDGGSLAQLADSLLHETVDRAVGVTSPVSAAGSA